MPEDDKPEKRESAAQRIKELTIPQKVRLAMTGGKEARTILILENNRAVQLAILDNPKLTQSEVVGIAQSRSVSDDVLRKIAANREWIKLYPVRLALVKNPKTPIGVSVKFVGTLHPTDLKVIARSKSVASVVAQAANRQLIRKQ